MGERVAIIGAGGHGREVLQALRAVIRAGRPVTFAGFFDDHPPLDLLAKLGVECLGGTADAPRFDGTVYLGIGGGAVKEKLAAGTCAAARLVHPLADVGEDVELAPGSIVFAQATVTTNITVGLHAHVGRGAAVGHDSVLEDWCSIMPLASVSGNVHVGERAFVGTGALVRQGTVVGADAMVGMGSVVLRDVPPGVTVVGNPATELTRRH